MTGEQTSSGEKVHVVFKTHLDIRFTDLAANVVDEYLTTFILKALPLSERMQGEDGQSKFIWTVGSWLIEEYLQSAPEEQRMHRHSVRSAQSSTLSGITSDHWVDTGSLDPNGESYAKFWNRLMLM